MNDKVKEAIINLNYLVECRCDEAYTDRGRHDSHSACDYAEEVKIVADHVAAIEAKLAKAVDALQLVTDACDEGVMVSMGATIYNSVPAWPIEEARAILTEIKGETT